jgi:hypothetical protein
MDSFATDAGGAYFYGTFAVTLPAHGFSEFGYEINGGNPIDFDTIVTYGLGAYVGTGYLTPDVGFGEVVRADNPAITVALENPFFGGPEPVYTGGLTVTYYYGDTDPPFLVPEPASLLILAAGLLGVVGFQQTRRSRWEN